MIQQSPFTRLENAYNSPDTLKVFETLAQLFEEVYDNHKVLFR